MNPVKNTNFLLSFPSPASAILASNLRGRTTCMFTVDFRVVLWGDNARALAERRRKKRPYIHGELHHISLWKSQPKTVTISVILVTISICPCNIASRKLMFRMLPWNVDTWSEIVRTIFDHYTSAWSARACVDVDRTPEPLGMTRVWRNYMWMMKPCGPYDEIFSKIFRIFESILDKRLFY